MSKLLTNDDLNHTGWIPPVSWFVSRVCWREVGNRLRSHPEVIEQSRQYVDQVLEDGSHHCSPNYLRDWKEILEGGISSVEKVLMSPDDGKNQVLKTCSPMPLKRLLSPEERNQIHSRVKQEVKELGLG